MKIGYYSGSPAKGVNIVKLLRDIEETKNPEAFDPNFNSFNIKNIKIKLDVSPIFPLRQIVINDTPINVSYPTADGFCYQSPDGFDIYNLALDFDLNTEAFGEFEFKESIDILYYYG